MRADVLRDLQLVLIALLAAQFILGMFVSLYPIPLIENFGSFYYIGTGLGVHHYLAASLLIIAVLVMIFSFVMKSPLLSKLSVGGFLLLIGAFASGVAFVYVQKSNFYVIAMGAFFISALIVYMSSIFSIKV